MVVLNRLRRLSLPHIPCACLGACTPTIISSPCRCAEQRHVPHGGPSKIICSTNKLSVHLLQFFRPTGHEILVSWFKDGGRRAAGRPPQQQPSKMDTPECPVCGPAVHNRLRSIDHAVRVAAQHTCLLPGSTAIKCVLRLDRKHHGGRFAMRRTEKSQAVWRRCFAAPASSGKIGRRRCSPAPLLVVLLCVVMEDANSVVYRSNCSS